ncbi:MAG: hypothetical protein RI988_3460 [Pseudomonadota bacterium]|jgi:hypothetical protein
MIHQTIQHTTREGWLHAFAEAARPRFIEAGHPLPETLRIGIGWGSGGARSRAIGECYYGAASADGVRAIIITPGAGMDDAARAADVLTHELAHAALPEGVGHKAPFKRLVTALGLEGKATATVAGDAWRAWALPIIESLGPYPHAALSAGSTGKKKQNTRMLKAECSECGYTVRVTRKWLDVGSPRCGLCEDAPRLICEDAGGEEGDDE